MTGIQVAHPSLDQLTAFAQGRLSDVELAELSAHLGECIECREKVEATGDDTLVSLLRAAATEHDSIEKINQPETVAQAAAPAKAATALPAELADHGRYRVQELLGVLGGAIGTYFTIKNTNGPRERLFAIKASIICWVFVALVFAIQKWDQTQLRIREEESRPSA